MNTNFKYKTLLNIIAIFMLILLSACSSTTGILKFSSLQYPASMSAFLYDKNDKIVMKGDNLETIEQFTIKKTFWSLAYGLIPLSQEESISQKLNEKIKANGGDGVINLTVTIEHGVTNKIFSFLMYIPSYVPILPSTARVSISGEIVKLVQPASSYIQDKDFNRTYTSKKDIENTIKKMINENI